MKQTQINNIEKVLNFLHNDARNDFMKIGKARKASFHSMQPSDFEYAYLPVSKEQGQFLKQLIIRNKCKNVVEFGTSFGVSTIYLADGVRQTGGKIISTELLESKAKKAEENISNANLREYVEIKIGDAMQTLKEHSSPIDFLFLDGWKDLYLPLFQMLEPLFLSGTIIYADNMNMEDTKPYANYLMTNRNIYTTKSVDNGRGFLTKIK